MSSEPEVKKARISRTSWTFDEPCTEMEWTSISSVAISVESTSTHKIEDSSDLTILGVRALGETDQDDADLTKNEPVLAGKTKEADDSLGGALSAIMKENAKAFKSGASLGSTTPTLRVASDGSMKRFVLLGLGKASAGDEKKVDRSTASSGSIGLKVGSVVASQCASEKAVKSCSVILPSDVIGNDTSILRDIACSFYSELYSDNRYRTGDNVKVHGEALEGVTIIVDGDDLGLSDDTVATCLAEGRSLARGQTLTKDIVNAPHNVLNSLSMANVARRIAAESAGKITCTVLGKVECEKRGMGAYLSVARGSETEPQFIHMVYCGKGEVKQKVGIVGKGLLFDTGGYNIKTAMMELMKFDCGGAAAVFGAARAIAEIEPEGVEAHFVVAACENMISSKAYVPSDVLTASNGKTIEVINTDAEGRLTLADALVYADKEVGCDSIIELSTLTGACMVSLGKQICGVWTSDDKMAEQLEDASRETGEKAWRMPLATDYNEQLESKIADLKNCGTRFGGAITAALFLQNFVDKKKPFAHIDMAGPTWSEKTCATGFGAKLVTEWIRAQGRG